MDERSIRSVDSLQIAGQAMRASQERLRTISENVAHMSTPGAKRLVPGPSSFTAALSRSTMTVGVPLPTTGPVRIDTAAGALRPTGRAMDIAIEGSGFFELVAPSGALYTRRGDFKLDAQQRLVSQEGYPVLGQRGEITLSGTQPVEISRTGEVRQGGKLIDTLRVVGFEKDTALMPAGVALFAASEDARLAALEHPQVRSGFLEASNVGMAAEMVQLMESMRQFEAMSKIVQMVDESTEKAIRKLGEM